MVPLLLACAAGAPGGSGTPGPGAWIVGPAVTCDDPADGWTGRFREEGVERGLVRPLPAVEEVLGFDVAGMGGALAARDLDDDGDVDLLVGGLDGAPDLYLNDGTGRFALLEGRVQVPGAPYGSLAGPAAVDLDGDRRPEVLAAGVGAFTVLAPAGEASWAAADPAWVEEAADPQAILTLAVGDANGDGWLDVALPGTGPASEGPDSDAAYGGPDRVLLADGAGGFTLGAELVSEGEGSRTQLASFTDRDGDGDADLYVVADLGPPSAFWRNDGPDEAGGVRWVDDAAEVGADLDIAGMGIDAADLNEDGWLDYCISDVGPPRCIVSDGLGGFYEEGQARGLLPDEEVGIHGAIGWSIELVDLDNDGWVDLAMAGGPEPATLEAGEELPDLLWAGTEGGAFQDVTGESGFGTRANHVGLAAADVDGDGFLDLFVAGPGEPPRLWMNRCGSGAWLEVDLWGPPENTDGLGARVTLEAGGRLRVREVAAVRAHAQGPTRVHFGLGETERVERLEVRWPDGTVQVLEDVGVRREVVALHPRGVPRDGS